VIVFSISFQSKIDNLTNLYNLSKEKNDALIGILIGNGIL